MIVCQGCSGRRPGIAITAVIALSMSLWACGGGEGTPVDSSIPETAPEFPQLDVEAASGFARLALDGITREYPNKLDHVINDEGEVLSPRALHPIFFGSYDWHSSVHGYWLLVRLLKLFPELPEAEEVRGTLSTLLTAGNVAAELAYLDQPSRASFERTYGWAWLLKLTEELHGWDDEDGRRWRATLARVSIEFGRYGPEGPVVAPFSAYSGVYTMISPGADHGVMPRI